MQTTVETYLPPITSKVTNFTTITQYMTYLQSLAASSNMSYVKSTLDVGAAINSCKFLWSSFTCFENLVIHLGGFHFRKENFQVFFLQGQYEITCLTTSFAARNTVTVFTTFLRGALRVKLQNKMWRKWTICLMYG